VLGCPSCEKATMPVLHIPSTGDEGSIENPEDVWCSELLFRILRRKRVYRNN